MAAYRIVECGGGGNCLFHSIAHGLKSIQRNPFQMKDVRGYLANTITPDNVSEFIRLTQEDQSLAKPPGTIPMHQLMGNQTVRAIVSKCGRAYQGTDTTLRWLVHNSRLFENIGFLIFTEFGIDHICIVDTPKTRAYITLVNRSSSDHWQILEQKSNDGLFKSVISTNQKNKTIQKIISKQSKTPS
jgi:hypothetical protein